MQDLTPFILMKTLRPSAIAHQWVYNVCILAICFQPVIAENWIYPMVRDQSFTSTDEQVTACQAAEMAVWKYSNKDFICRQIIPAYATFAHEIRINSVIRSEDGEFRRESTVLKMDEKGKWSLFQNKQVLLDQKKGASCYEIFRKKVMAARFSSDEMPLGVDISIILWECRLDAEKSDTILQALQYSEPKTPEGKEEQKQIDDTLYGD